MMAWLWFLGYMMIAFLMLRPAAIAFARWDGKKAKNLNGEDWIPVAIMAVFWPVPVLYWTAKFLFRRNLARFIAWYVKHEHVSRAQRRALHAEKLNGRSEDRKRQLQWDIEAAERRLREVNAELGLREDD